MRGIIKKLEVLDENYLPEKIIGRKKELKAIALNIKPLFYGQPMINMFLHGPTGTGKTSIMRFVIEKISEEDDKIKGVYVNCWMMDTTYAVLMKIAEAFDTAMGLAKLKRSNAELLEYISSKAKRKKIFIVLDEVDKLKNDEVLYLLSREGYGIVMISNYNIALDKLDNRIRSSLSYEEIEFKPYDYDEMLAILKARAEHAFYEGSFPEVYIKVAAKNAGGDARVGIAILKNAALHAERNNKEKVDREDVLYALKVVKGVKLKEQAESLKGKVKIIADIIKELGEADASLIASKYEEHAGEKIHERTLRYYLQELEKKGVIKTKGIKRWKTYFINEELLD
ncbi:MAG: AAA family ATPase [Candidatus Nanohaloarchaeota archaeon]|nr:AAA family ATPase [Candidatus Nanohaloarchaeota archaeon]